MRWARHVSRVRGVRYARIHLVGKCEGKRPLGTLRRRCEGSNEMDHTEIENESVD
jgi:hypothetical protein